MARTTISQDQIRPVDDKCIAVAQKRFILFFWVTLIVFSVLSISMFIDALHYFWQGNCLWSIGSYFVCISVLHTRFFDIKKNASPYNQRIDPNSLSLTLRVLEKICSHIWLVGFLLLAVARWVNL